MLVKAVKPVPASSVICAAMRTVLRARSSFEKLRAAGLIRIEQAGRCKVPSAIIERIVVEIDPYSPNDRMRAELVA
jgi:predicted transcriptional regulator